MKRAYLGVESEKQKKKRCYIKAGLQHKKENKSCATLPAVCLLHFRCPRWSPLKTKHNKTKTRPVRRKGGGLFLPGATPMSAKVMQKTHGSCEVTAPHPLRKKVLMKFLGSSPGGAGLVSPLKFDLPLKH